MGVLIIRIVLFRVLWVPYFQNWCVYRVWGVVVLGGVRLLGSGDLASRF